MLEKLVGNYKLWENKEDCDFYFILLKLNMWEFGCYDKI